MNCKQILQDEIFEKYFMNRLKESARVEFENHIKECRACQQEYQRQQMIILGIRQVAQKEMKEQIKTKVDNIRKENKQIKWQMLLKIAAVILFLSITPFAIYYYQNKIPAPDTQTKLINDKNVFQREMSQPEISQEEETKKINIPTTKSSQTASQVSDQQKEIVSLPLEAMGGGSQPQKIEDLKVDESTGIQEPAQEDLAPAGEIHSPNLLGTLDIQSEKVNELPTTKIYRLVVFPTDQEIIHTDFDQIREKNETEIFPGSKIIDQKRSVPKNQITVEESQSKRLKTRSISGTTSISDMVTDTLTINKAYHFLSDSHLIKINLILAHTKFEEDEHEFPSVFESKILNKELNKLEMEWLVNRIIYFLEPNNIILEKQGDTILRAIFDEHTIYQIDLGKTETQAVLLN